MLEWIVIGLGVVVGIVLMWILAVLGLWWFMGSYMIRDVRGLTRSLSNLPAGVQTEIATEASKKINKSLSQTSTKPSLSQEKVWELKKKQLKRAQDERWQSIYEGATSETNPEWAKAALWESFLMAEAGKFNNRQSRKTKELIFKWINNLVSERQRINF